MSDRKKRDPLDPGHPRRLTDARCAWRKMTDAQREEFLAWIKEEEAKNGEAT